MRKDENTPLLTSKEGKTPDLEDTEISNIRVEDGLQKGDLEKPLPRMADPFFLDPEPEVEIEEGR